MSRHSQYPAHPIRALPARKYSRAARTNRPPKTAAAAKEMTAMKTSAANSCWLYTRQIVPLEVG